MTKLGADWFIRPAVVSDAPQIAAVHEASRTQAYQHLMDWDLLNVTSSAEREANWRQWLDEAESIGKEIFVAETSGGIVGFAVVGPREDGGVNSKIAELDRIYVEPSQWQRGIGKELFRKCLEWVRQRRYKEMCVWTLEGNVRARRFYESLGFTWDGVRRKIGPYPEDVRYHLGLD